MCAALTPAKPGRAELRLATWLATWFGAGLLPRAPGTWGSLAALPFAWALMWLGGPWLLLAATALVFGLGLWAAGRYMQATGAHDPGAVVIDEIAGQWLTLCVAPLDPIAYLLGFVLFRIADVLKPWPASWLDRRVGGAFGVMIDDLAAAVYAGLLLWAADRWLLTGSSLVP
jgi:phosphatidylglycerophosphatase A